jgi:hypothetical protein
VFVEEEVIFTWDFQYHGVDFDTIEGGGDLVVDDGFEADIFYGGEVEGFLLIDGAVGGSGEPGLHGGLMLIVHESGYDFFNISVH